jgi:hypothetical protein
MSIEIKQRKAKWAELKPYDFFADEGDYIEITEWSNGEGFDVSTVISKHYQSFSLTDGQWQALQALVAYKE